MRPDLDSRGGVGHGVRHALSVSRGIRYEVDMRALQVARDAATAGTRYVVHMEYQQDGKWIPIRRDLDLADTFVRQDAGWLLRSSRVGNVNAPR